MDKVSKEALLELSLFIEREMHLQTKKKLIEFEIKEIESKKSSVMQKISQDYGLSQGDSFDINTGEISKKPL